MALTGAILATVSVALSSIIDHFYWFFIFFSVFGGVGSGLILVQVLAFWFLFIMNYMISLGQCDGAKVFCN